MYKWAFLSFLIVVGLVGSLVGLDLVGIGVFNASASTTQKDTDDWQNLGLYGAQGRLISGLAFAPDTHSLYLCNQGVFNVYQYSLPQQAWQPLTNTLWGCGSLAFDEQRNWLYITTNAYGWVVRSRDGGVTWDPLIYISPEDENGPFHWPMLVTVNPVTTSTIMVTTHGRERGVLRTEDDGETWEWAQISTDGSNWKTFLEGTPINLSFDPTDPGYVYLSVQQSEEGSDDSGIYQSTDGGKTFQRIFSETLGGGVGVAVSPSGTVFVAINGYLQRSWDQGTNWTATIMDSDFGSPFFSFHPELPETVWVQNFRSDDEGDTWQYMGEGFFPPLVDPISPDTYYRLTHYGVARSTDAGENWVNINTGLEEVSVQQVIPDPADAGRIFVKTDGGVGKTEDGGATWAYPIFSGGYSDVEIDPNNPQTVYVVQVSCRVHKSIDGGETWTFTDLFNEEQWWCPHLHSMALDPDDSQVAYLAAANTSSAENRGAVFKTIDGGISWTNTTLMNVPVEKLLWVSATNTLYAGAQNAWEDDTLGGIYRSANQGEDWERSGLNGIDIYDLAVDPRNALWLYAATKNGLYRSTDGGEIWTAVIPGENTYVLAVDPNNPDCVFALVHSTIFVSPDAGDSWLLYYEVPEEVGYRRPTTVFVPWLPPENTPQFNKTSSTPSMIYMGSNQGLYVQEIRIEYKVFAPLMMN